MSAPVSPPSAAERPLVDGEVLSIGDHRITVRLSARRGRLGLTLERDGLLTLRAPVDCAAGRAQGFVRANQHWIEAKLRLRDARRPLHLTRELADGESHRFLGREYRLLLVDPATVTAASEVPPEPVRLVSGRLCLDRTLAAHPARGRAALAGWYARQGLVWAKDRVQPWAARMDVNEQEVEVRDLGHKWGTYHPPGRPGGRGRIALHWAAFQLPIHLVDYLIAHELAHVRVSGHGPDYWRLLRRALPQCDRWKAEMDEMGRRVWMGDVPQRNGGIRKS